MTDDNILDDFTVEPEHNKETLIKYLQKYPHLSNRLIELYFEFLWQRLEIDELTEEDKRQFEVLMNEISNKPNTFTTPEVEEKSPEDLIKSITGLTSEYEINVIFREVINKQRQTIQSQQAETERLNKEIKRLIGFEKHTFDSWKAVAQGYSLELEKLQARSKDLEGSLSNLMDYTIGIINTHFDDPSRIDDVECINKGKKVLSGSPERAGK